MADGVVALQTNPSTGDVSGDAAAGCVSRLDRRNALADVLDEAVTNTEPTVLVDALTKIHIEHGEFLQT